MGIEKFDIGIPHTEGINFTDINPTSGKFTKGASGGSGGSSNPSKDSVQKTQSGQRFDNATEGSAEESTGTIGLSKTSEPVGSTRGLNSKESEFGQFG